jgi:hypothetical protein
MSNEYLRGEKISAIVETTLRDASMLQREFQAFKDAGYETELRVVAVPLEVSRAGTVSRYIEQVKDYGAGRWTPGSAHDVAAANVGDTVSGLVASGVVDRVVVQDRDGRVFHDERVSVGGIERGEAARAAVDAARDVTSLNVEQAQAWVEYTGDALRERVVLGQDDPDLVNVCNRLATVDAGAVVPQAYPADIQAQNDALRGFEGFVVDGSNQAAQGLGGTEQSRSVRSASYPTRLETSGPLPKSSPLDLGQSPARAHRHTDRGFGR